MSNQNYYMINKDSNICENITIWDGNPDTWTPPSNYLMLAQAITQTKVWLLNADNTDYVLTESVGDGDIGFTWDGKYLETCYPKPPTPLPPVQADGIPSV